MPVNICEQKTNVGTWKMHMTLSRLTTGLEGIKRCNIWLRPAREENKSLDLSSESVEILHKQKPFAQLCEVTEAKIVDMVSKELLPASQPKLLQAYASPRMAMFTLLEAGSKYFVKQYFIRVIRALVRRKDFLGDSGFLAGICNILDLNYY